MADADEREEPDYKLIWLAAVAEVDLLLTEEELAIRDNLLAFARTQW